MWVMDSLDALARSQGELQTRLDLIGDDQWHLATPCTEWTVSDLVNHVLLGTRMSVQLLEGAARSEVMAGLGDDLVSGGDPKDDYPRLADRMRELFGGDGGLDGTVDHPMGPIPRTMFIGFRIGDQVTHAWDLARAIGADERLDPALVAYAWDDLQPMREMITSSGMFGDGPSGSVDDGADLQLRYLDLVGRRP